MNLRPPVAALILLLAALCVPGCAPDAKTRNDSPAATTADLSASVVLAGGCFWCAESDLEKVAGVGDVLAGYAGGTSAQPTYRNHADHLEVVEAPYDPATVTYRELVEYFLRHIDPLDVGGQFCDRGHSYTTAIFYRTEEERAQAQAALDAAAEELGQSLATRLLKLDKFWLAESYHQDYYIKNPIRYQYYRRGCGRDARVSEVWKKPD